MPYQLFLIETNGISIKPDACDMTYCSSFFLIPSQSVHKSTRYEKFAHESVPWLCGSKSCIAPLSDGLTWSIHPSGRPWVAVGSSENTCVPVSQYSGLNSIPWKFTYIAYPNLSNKMFIFLRKGSLCSDHHKEAFHIAQYLQISRLSDFTDHFAVEVLISVR